MRTHDETKIEHIITVFLLKCCSHKIKKIQEINYVINLNKNNVQSPKLRIKLNDTFFLENITKFLNRKKSLCNKINIENPVANISNMIRMRRN